MNKNQLIYFYKTLTANFDDLVVFSSVFKKQLKKLELKNDELEVLLEVISTLANHKSLDEKYKNHKLSGKYSKYYECHIKPDILLVYNYENGKLILYLYAIGSHSELF
ncbi:MULTISPECIES: type II toxin-antitoxin system YafQ family toxin [unclassified Campylobacter]|uniref:type II toxin-antitoxin system YafQ family toxin n=1 Tax=unclassified Campylobacter TaxID=2593542 RepID=UPI001D4BF46E|nr:type II toxin-antitoxin system YafQ family toxin [Campylobacter sp. RM12651]MBZ7983886.1 type II toxin-antitoxin system YafQ family toxin [Campylobacter sp. RM12647]ULO04384.1 toxin-antitoxin system, toxin component, YafQ family [Campylobacter sp. RM12651]